LQAQQPRRRSFRGPFAQGWFARDVQCCVCVCAFVCSVLVESDCDEELLCVFVCTPFARARFEQNVSG
jgi:hypothetical protein